MLAAGQQVELSIEKPAVGGRMIARHEGQVVFVQGAIPGERVLAQIDKADRQLAFATATDVLMASPDRRPPYVDPLCGGCLYAHISYARQLSLKAEIVQDAFARLGRIRLPSVAVTPSPERGYRMRGRLYVQSGRAGFYKEGSHSICDAASTGLLTEQAVSVATGLADALRASGTAVRSIEITENIPADQRALHAELDPGASVEGARLAEFVRLHALTGCSARGSDGLVIAGDPSVSDSLDVLTAGRAPTGSLRRRAESFFQANRFLLPRLVSTVLEAVPAGDSVLDLYAGVGLFAVALAADGRKGIVAVEGDRSSGGDLQENAAQFPGAIRVAQESVERFLSRDRGQTGTIVVDPPRTGISRAAMTAAAQRGAGTIVYVSCDPATMARDSRRLLDSGYELQWLRAFDLFPNTPHVESVALFRAGANGDDGEGLTRSHGATEGHGEQ